MRSLSIQLTGIVTSCSKRGIDHSVACAGRCTPSGSRTKAGASCVAHTQTVDAGVKAHVVCIDLPGACRELGHRATPPYGVGVGPSQQDELWSEAAGSSCPRVLQIHCDLALSSHPLGHFRPPSLPTNASPSKQCSAATHLRLDVRRPAMPSR
eukprot:scaffold314762_cov32-Tisochrysis_lutea.AAC.3